MTPDQLTALAARLRDHASDYITHPDDACKHSDLLAASEYLRQCAEVEPVATVRVHDTGGNAGIAWSGVPTENAGTMRGGTPLYTHPQPQQAGVPGRWADIVEQRLLTWRQRFVNRSGDQLALDDFMDQASIDDLIDYVCDEHAAPQPPSAQAEPTIDINIKIAVPANWSNRLDMQWIVEREIHADRWSWSYAAPQADAIEALREVARIAHDGGGQLGFGEALVAIRKLTLPFWTRRAVLAAGIAVRRGRVWQSDMLFREIPRPSSPLVSNVEWNPLADDGDALRLAVKLAMYVALDNAAREVVACAAEGSVVKERCGDDPYAATRRAIVRAAAEIGQQMGGGNAE